MTTTAQDIQTQLKVGLEIHVELATRTKMWTAAPNVAHPDYHDAQPNSLVDPVVIGMPGTLPVMNGRAVELSIQVGLALGCKIADWCKWDRKSYYYPDLPKNYQISQYDLPLCGDGAANVRRPDGSHLRVGIIRAHLEEDAGKLLHEAPGGLTLDGSIVDLNRAGTPLLEIVTEPDFDNADDVISFCQWLRQTCMALGVSEGVMQKGHMRFEPNINVIIEHNGRVHKTPIVEVKNLNSFRSVRASIEYEYARQVEQWLEDGIEMGPGAKSTRGWDDVREITVLQREKEDAHDYRYFPDPDLVPVTVDSAMLEQMQAEVDASLFPYMERLIDHHQLSEKQVAAMWDDPGRMRVHRDLCEAGLDSARATTIVFNNLARMTNELDCGFDDLKITATQIITIERMLSQNTISSNGASDLYNRCHEVGPSANPETLAEQHGLLQISDSGALDEWCDAAILAEPQAADDVRNGNMKAIGRLVGTVMKLSKGQANPKTVSDQLREKLSS